MHVCRGRLRYIEVVRNLEWYNVPPVHIRARAQQQKVKPSASNRKILAKGGVGSWRVANPKHQYFRRIY